MIKYKYIKTISAALISAMLITGCSAHNSGSTANDSSRGVTTSSTDTSAATEKNTNGDSSDNSTNESSDSASNTSSSATTVSNVTSIDTSDMFTNRDREIGYDESTSVKLALNGDSISSSSSSVAISGSTAMISEEGTYIISGTLDDGMIIIDAYKNAKIQLVLDNASINSSTSAVIYICNADKVFITLAAGSENTLSNGGEYIAIDDNNIDAVIFSKDDLTLNGSGILTINAGAGHGIVSKDDLVITGGTYNITAAGHGLSANDSIRIADGSFTILSGKDGIHAENSEDEALGFVYIAGGDLNITAQGEGISAGYYLMIDNGSYDITTEGTESDDSAKGLKAAGNLIVNDGTFTISTTDDCLHSNSDMSINRGSFSIATGDDGLHADNDLIINSGVIDITDCYEGLEGLTITVNDGTININASDDGINAAGGTDSSGFGGFGHDAFSADSDANI